MRISKSTAFSKHPSPSATVTIIHELIPPLESVTYNPNLVLTLVLLSYSQIGDTAMPYQPISRYHLLPGLTYSAFSRPRREQPDGTYEIHLVKSQNPAYIPSDLEAWPIYYEAIQETLVNYPDAHDAAIEAIRETRKKLIGLENLDVPPGTMPL